MRTSLTIGLGLAAAAVLAVAGIASANGSAGSSAATSPRQSTATTAISRADAEQIAMATVAGSTVTETRLDIENDRTVWNVHLSTSTGTVEVKVDAQTGNVRIDDDAPGIAPGAGILDDDDNPGHGANDDNNRGDDDGDDRDANDDNHRGCGDGPGHS